MIRVRSQSLHKLKHNISTLMWYDETIYQAITVRKTHQIKWNLYKEDEEYLLLASRSDIGKACLFRLDMNYSKRHIAYPKLIRIGVGNEKKGYNVHTVKTILAKNPNWRNIKASI